MVKRLEKSLSEDETSILKSKITALQSQIVERELDSIDARISEAQSYLTKYKVLPVPHRKSNTVVTFADCRNG
jgi:hypothetical protein